MPREPDDNDLTERPREPAKAMPLTRHCYEQYWFCPSHAIDHSTNQDCIIKHKKPHRKYQYEEYDADNPNAKMFTHWAMNKEYTGKLCVPWEQYDTFVAKLIQGLTKGHRLYMTEKRTKIVRVFMEFDFAASHIRHLPDQLVDTLVQIAIKTFIRFYIPYKHISSLDHVISKEPNSDHLMCTESNSKQLNPEDDQFDYRSLFPLHAIVCDTVTKYERTYNNETGEITHLRDRHVMKGIRVYLPTLYATSEQLQVMRRAVLYEWMQHFGKSIPGVEAFDKMFDICSYRSNGLRCIGCRKVAPCFVCVKQRELLKQAAEVGIDPYQSTIPNTTSLNANSLSSNTNISSPNKASSANTIARSIETPTRIPNFYCRLCNGGNAEHPKDLDVGRVYRPYQVYAITLVKPKHGKSSADDDKTKSNESNHNINTDNSTYIKILHAASPCIALDLDFDRLQIYQSNIGQLVRNTLIRTKFTSTHPTVQLWSLDRYEQSQPEKNFSLERVMPDESKNSSITLSTGESIQVCEQAARANKSKAATASHRFSRDHDFCQATAAFINSDLIKEYRFLDVYEMTSNAEQKWYSVYVRGSGNRYCQNMNTNQGCHRTVGIYFVITVSGITQRCFCKCPDKRLAGVPCSKFKSVVTPLSESLRCLLFPDSIKVSSSDIFERATQFAKLKHHHTEAMMLQDRKKKQKYDEITNLKRGLFVEKTNLTTTIIHNPNVDSSDRTIRDWYELKRFDDRMLLFSTVGYDIIDDIGQQSNINTSHSNVSSLTTASTNSVEQQQVFIPQTFYRPRLGQPKSSSATISILPPDFDMHHIIQLKNILDTIVLNAEKQSISSNTSRVAPTTRSTIKKPSRKRQKPNPSTTETNNEDVLQYVSILDQKINDVAGRNNNNEGIQPQFGAAPAAAAAAATRSGQQTANAFGPVVPRGPAALSARALTQIEPGAKRQKIEQQRTVVTENPKFWNWFNTNIKDTRFERAARLLPEKSKLWYSCLEEFQNALLQERNVTNKNLSEFNIPQALFPLIGQYQVSSINISIMPQFLDQIGALKLMSSISSISIPLNEQQYQAMQNKSAAFQTQLVNNIYQTASEQLRQLWQRMLVLLLKNRVEESMSESESDNENENNEPLSKTSDNTTNDLKIVMLEWYDSFIDNLEEFCA